jgi:hypothetical protein
MCIYIIYIHTYIDTYIDTYIHTYIDTYIHTYITHDRWTTLMSFQQFWGGWECWELDSLRTRGATQHSKCCAGNDGNADPSRTSHFYGVETKHDWLVVWNRGILLLSIQLGMSSSQLKNSMIFQDGGSTTRKIMNFPLPRSITRGWEPWKTTMFEKVNHETLSTDRPLKKNISRFVG